MKSVQLAGLWEEMLRYPETMEEKHLEEEEQVRKKARWIKQTRRKARTR